MKGRRDRRTEHRSGLGEREIRRVVTIAEDLGEPCGINRRGVVMVVRSVAEYDALDAQDVSADDRMSRLQIRALPAVLSCRTIAEAAETAGVAERTMRRWLADLGFRDALRDHARDAARDAASRLLRRRTNLPSKETLDSNQEDTSAGDGRTRSTTNPGLTRGRAGPAHLRRGVALREPMTRRAAR